MQNYTIQYSEFFTPSHCSTALSFILQHYLTLFNIIQSGSAFAIPWEYGKAREKHNRVLIKINNKLKEHQGTFYNYQTRKFLPRNPRKLKSHGAVSIISGLFQFIAASVYWGIFVCFCEYFSGWIRSNQDKDNKIM